MVQDNYDLLSDIWGGSPSTTSLPFGIDAEYDETPGSSGTISDREGEGSVVFWLQYCLLILLIMGKIITGYYHKVS